MKPPRVVLDTNVLVSALLFRSGALAWLRFAWQGERVLPLLSRATATELIRVLAYPKFRLDPAETEAVLGDYMPWCETVAVPPRLALPRCRDPADRPFLALARAGRADALVTGDKDLLALEGRFDIPILTPAALRVRLGPPGR
ncbi:MAG: putative toxin-antitoxin system toxin component, PIN family [Alphaproteobacteria bacterium]|nr:putative toxin-antitoxin system toxin component, PIN family [Alphaproteobacteria bacterium]